MGRRCLFAQTLLHLAMFSLGILPFVSSPLLAQQTADVSAPSTSHGVPSDWSNRHIIYTRNGSAEDVNKLRDDPRFLHSTALHYLREHPDQFRHSAEGTLTGLRLTENNSLESRSDGDGTEFLSPIDGGPPKRLPTFAGRGKRSKVDWSVSLGPTGGLAVGESPSVYTYNFTTPKCSNLTATPVVVGDFLVYTINATPAAGTQANLVGLTNLYTTGAGTGFCIGSTAPSFLFSYAIGTGGSQLSSVLSLDGSKVAWIENRTPTNAFLHITNWVANEGGTATSPVAVSGTFSNGSCTPAGSSCDYAIDYTNATYPGCNVAFKAGDTHSELYVDYSSNSGFIGANNGLLYHIKNIFSATVNPSVDFCTPVNLGFETAPNSAMSGPVYDYLHNLVFITDSEKIYSFTVNATASTPNFAAGPWYLYGNAASGYNYPTGPGPLLDPFNNFVYVFSTNDLNSKTSVTQLPTNLGSGVSVPLGPKSTNTTPFLFYGAFDNHYFSNGPKSATSTLYSCGTDATTTTAQDLFAISFIPATGVVNTTPAMSNNKNINPGGGNGICSPLTEFYDGTNDRLFVGMGQPTKITGANVVTMWNINNQLTNTSGSGGTLPTYTAQATGYLGGASGISADNTASATSQAENIYFSTETIGTASTAVPATTPYNVNGIYKDNATFTVTGGLDQDGNAYSSNLLGASATWNGTTFTFGTANKVDAWQNTTITLPAGQYNTLEILGNSVNGNAPAQTLVVTYSDLSKTTLTQSFSDWFTPQNYAGESIAVTTAYRNVYNGTKDNRTFNLYGYSFAIDPNKTVATLTLPAPISSDNVLVVLAVALSTNCGGQDFCAVKLTQTGLQ